LIKETLFKRHNIPNSITYEKYTTVNINCGKPVVQINRKLNDLIDTNILHNPLHCGELNYAFFNTNSLRQIKNYKADVVNTRNSKTLLRLNANFNTLTENADLGQG
jgi:hypothetical protein